MCVCVCESIMLKHAVFSIISKKKIHLYFGLQACYVLMSIIQYLEGFASVTW